MIYAPVLIPTLCRYEKFVKCFESLQKNTWADLTDVFIALDYPVHESHQDGYKKIQEYCNQVISSGKSGFKSVTLICRDTNYGAIGNFESLVIEVFREYDRCICTFDDIEHSPNFIQYMDEMLESFQGDKNVFMVTGYSYPVKWKTRNGCNVVKQNLEGSIWGVGYWKREWEELYNYLKSGELIRQFPDAFREGRFSKMTDWAVKDYVNAVVNGVAHNSNLKRVTDISMRIYLAVAGKYSVMPIVSKSRNLGFDGTGAFCEEIGYNKDLEMNSSNYRFDLQPIDESDSFVPVIDLEFDNDANLPVINQFDRRPAGEREEMLAKAEVYSKLSLFERQVLNIRANTSRVVNKIGRMIRRY